MISKKMRVWLSGELEQLIYACYKLLTTPKNFGVVDEEAEGIRKEIHNTTEFIESYIKEEK